MPKRALSAILAFILVPALAGAVEIRSVTPATAIPGETITVVGGPFPADVAVVLGDRTLEPDTVGRRQLTFTLPEVQEDTYSLFLRSGDTASPDAFALRVVTPAPRITAISPANIDVCSSVDEREVEVAGANFRPGANLLLDGKAVSHSRVSSSTLTFTLPDVDPGAHGVEVIGPDGKQSLPHSLYVNNIPKIYSVSEGESFVNYYEMIIEGRNFSFDSKLVVHEDPSLTVGQTRPQRLILNRGAPADPGGGGLGSGETLTPRRTDTFTFIDCRTLIYYRYPYSNQPKDLAIQIVNPDGKTSGRYQTSLP